MDVGREKAAEISLLDHYVKRMTASGEISNKPLRHQTVAMGPMIG
jgi:hypothetical protein